MEYTKQFIATVNDAVDTTVTWSVVEETGGEITSLGFYTSPSSPGTYHVRATSVADPDKFAEAEVTVIDISISISPLTPSILFGATQQFYVDISPTGMSVVWTCENPALLDANGFFTGSVDGEFEVTVTSVDDLTKSAKTTITVAPE